MTSQELPVITDEQRKTLDALAKIFMPFASLKRQARYPVEGARSQFVHYTTAENALKIIETRRLWMRSTMCMGDYREIDHGHDLLVKVLHSRRSDDQTRYEALIGLLETCVPGVAASAFSILDQNWNQIRFNTYVASLSEHDSGQEDLYGRLSMWRAFGGTSARVALVFSVPWFSPGAEILKVMFSPVAYFTEDQLAKEIDTVLENVRANVDFVSGVQPREWVAGTIYTMLLSAVTCLKHCGFDEEKEWRVIHGPFPLISEHMENGIECVSGVPQRVFKLPLDANISPELEFSRIFEKVIIGPTQYPVAMSGAFSAKLSEAGVSNAESKVVISEIPIRT